MEVVDSQVMLGSQGWEAPRVGSIEKDNVKGIDGKTPPHYEKIQPTRPDKRSSYPHPRSLSLQNAGTTDHGVSN